VRWGGLGGITREGFGKHGNSSGEENSSINEVTVSVMIKPGLNKFWIERQASRIAQKLDYSHSNEICCPLAINIWQEKKWENRSLSD